VRRFLPELIDLIWNRQIDSGKVFDLERARRGRRRLPSDGPARGDMQITRNSIDTQKGSADWFTGDVYIDAVAAPATCDDTVTKTLQRTRCRLVQRLS